MLNRKTLYVCSDNEEDLVYQKEKRKLSIILLKEDVFIKIIQINKEDRLEKLLKENISSTFSYYDILTHYERVKYNGESYLVIYFLKYYNYLKEIINKAKDVKIKPYEFTKKFKMKNKGLNIIVREFKDEVYLGASVQQTIIYTKHFKQGEEVNYYVDKCLEQLKETFNIESFKLFIQENLYNNKLYELTKNIELIKGKVR